MSHTRAVYPVDVLLPDHWWELALFRLRQELTISGVKVPKGFITDGASVPRIFWFLFPPICQYFPAAVVHDYLLKSGTSYKIANRHFRQTLIQLKVPKWRYYAMSAAVAVYGVWVDKKQ